VGIDGDDEERLATTVERLRRAIAESEVTLARLKAIEARAAEAIERVRAAVRGGGIIP
jgi:hypothetical protein